MITEGCKVDSEECWAWRVMTTCRFLKCLMHFDSKISIMYMNKQYNTSSLL